jgi:hypothetical protein
MKPTEVIGTWKRVLEHGESDEIMTIVGYDPGDDIATSNAGVKISSTKLKLDYVKIDLNMMVGDPFSALKPGDLPGEVISKTNKVEQPAPVIIGDLSKPAETRQVLNMTPQQLLISNAIKSMPHNETIAFNCTLPISFNMSSVLAIAKMANISVDDLAVVFEQEIQLNMQDIVKSIIASVK